MSYHKTIVMGNIGRDPEMRYTAGGDAICNFSVAVTEKYKDNERTTWYRISVFGKQGEAAGEYLKKGQMVLVEGRMQEEKYTSKDGVEKTSWSLRCDNWRFAGGKSEPTHAQQQHSQDKANGYAPDQGVMDMDESIPF